MDILGDRRFVEVPGTATHELPPLLVRMAPHVNRLDRVMGMASDLIEQEEIIPAQPAHPACSGAELQAERRRMDLALNLVDQYLAFVQHWQWGDSILEWIRQCETTFEKAMGMRLTFRQPPPLKCFSNQFLLYLNSPVANTAYHTWAEMSPSPISALPPERFQFQVLNMSLE